MDVRLDNPRVVGVLSIAGTRQSVIRTATPNVITEVFDMNEVSLSMSHYTTPLEVGDIVAENGAPFMQCPDPIVQENRLIYRALRLTPRSSTVSRFALRLENTIQRVQ